MVTLGVFFCHFSLWEVEDSNIVYVTFLWVVILETGHDREEIDENALIFTQMECVVCMDGVKTHAFVSSSLSRGKKGKYLLSSYDIVVLNHMKIYAFLSKFKLLPKNVKKYNVLIFQNFDFRKK